MSNAEGLRIELVALKSLTINRRTLARTTGLPTKTSLENTSWRYLHYFAIIPIRSTCRLTQIIDLRDTDKSQYFAITEFNNCFIIRSPSLFFTIKKKIKIIKKKKKDVKSRSENSGKRSSIFTQERGFNYA